MLYEWHCITMVISTAQQTNSLWFEKVTNLIFLFIKEKKKRKKSMYLHTVFELNETSD